MALQSNNASRHVSGSRSDRPSGRESRYQRQRIFMSLGAKGDARLRQKVLLIVGCGALGSHVAIQLARAGVGTVRLVDRDLVEWTNLHRQVGFTEEDARDARPKALALASHLQGANSEIEIESLVTEFNARTARDLTNGVDLIVDGTDNLPTRFLINDISLSQNIAWVYGGAVGDEAHAQIFVPGTGPCLRCILPDLPPPGSLPTCDTAGVIGPAPAAAASFESALALRYLASGSQSAGSANTPNNPDDDDFSDLIGRWIRLRLWHLEVTTTHVEKDPQCPACGGREFTFLSGQQRERSTVLCGRHAVQVVPTANGQEKGVDLEELAHRLAASGKVENKKFFVRFRPAAGDLTVTITIFQDGRAIVEGTTDAIIAQTLYDRWVGQ